MCRQKCAAGLIVLVVFSLGALPVEADTWKAVLVKDISSESPGSMPDHLTDVNGTLFFTADHETHGIELWKSDGTEAGTVMVKDIFPGSGGSFTGGLGMMRLIGMNFFLAKLTDVNGTLFFRATDGAHGDELWKSDGTEAGTVMVQDINLGAADSSPFVLTDVNGTLFFQAIDGTHGAELWKSDGTAAGTVMVEDICPGSGGSFPRHLTAVNGTLFFRPTEGTPGIELWKSDGTAAGTVMVKDFHSREAGFAPRRSHRRQRDAVLHSQRRHL